MRQNTVAESVWDQSNYQGVERGDHGCIALWRAVIDQVITDFKSTAHKTRKYNGKAAPQNNLGDLWFYRVIPFWMKCIS